MGGQRSRGISKGTRAPEGASPGQQHDRARDQGSPMWPGIFGGREEGCCCSWAYRDGRMQVKKASGACPLRSHRKGGEAP
jgi:hypothetical protein